VKRILSLAVFVLLSVVIIPPITAQTDSNPESNISKVHLKVIIDDGGQKSGFEKIYPNMDALAKDQQLDSLGINLQTINTDHISVIYDDSLDSKTDNNKKVVIIRKRVNESSDTIKTQIWVEKSSSKDNAHKGKNKTITIITEEDVNRDGRDESVKSEEEIIIDDDSHYTITIKKDKSGEEMEVTVKDENSDRKTTEIKKEINEEINVTVDENGEKHIEIRIKKEKTN